MKTVNNPFTYKRITLSIACFLWGLSQGIFAQSRSGMQLIEELTQYSAEDRTTVLEERLAAWLDRYNDTPTLLVASTAPLLNALEGQGYFKAASFLSKRLLAQKRLNFDAHLQRKLEHYLIIQEGEKVPLINFDHPLGLQLNFPKKFSQQKQLLFFWSSGCGHCLDALPKVAALQSQLATQGIRLLSISLDEEEEVFCQTASQYPWAHYSDFQGWEGTNVVAYRVFATPSFFLINEDQSLEKEFVSTAQVETWLQETSRLRL